MKSIASNTAHPHGSKIRKQYSRVKRCKAKHEQRKQTN